MSSKTSSQLKLAIFSALLFAGLANAIILISNVSPFSFYNTSNLTGQTFSLNVTNATNTLNLVNVTLVGNFTGSYVDNISNSTTVPLGANYTLNLTGLTNGFFVWGWKVWANDGAGLTYNISANQTLIVDNKTPVQVTVNTANNLNTSNFNFTFNVTWNEPYSWIANVSIFITNATNMAAGLAQLNWARNTTNSSLSAAFNNTPYLVTVANLPINTTYTWNMEACNILGNCTQLSSNNTLALDTGKPSISINTANNLNTSNWNITFNATAYDAVTGGLANVSLFITNATPMAAGLAAITWGINASNTSIGFANNTPELITVSNLPINTTYTYNIQVCNYVTNCSQAASNQTFAIDTGKPSISINTANNLNTSNFNFTFNATAYDAVTGGLANVSLFITNATPLAAGLAAINWGINASNTSIGFANNTPELITVNNLPINATYTYNVQVCNYVTNCSQASANQTFAIDTGKPSISINTANNLNTSNWNITFNATAYDAVTGGLANVSLFITNATPMAAGLAAINWGINASNTTIGFANNTPELITVSNLPINATYTYNVQVCNYVTNCTQAASNQTFAIDTGKPSISYNTANNLNTSNFNITFNVTAYDAVTGGLANISIFITNATNMGAGIPAITWGINASNTSIGFANNTPELITVNNLPINTTYTYNVQVCNYVTNCSQVGVNQTFAIDTGKPSIPSINTANNVNYSNWNLTLNITAYDAVTGGLANASIFITNATPMAAGLAAINWGANVTNSTIGAFNNTPILVSLSNLPINTTYTWNVQVCNYVTNCTQAASNQTFAIDTGKPSISYNTVNNLNSSNWNITFNATAYDAVTGGLANVSLFITNATPMAAGLAAINWGINASNTTIGFANNTPELITISNLPINTTYTYNIQVCNYVTNCSQASANQTFAIDTGKPSISYNTVNNLNSSNWNITFNATAYDAVTGGLANVSIFITNATPMGAGIAAINWGINASNTSIGFANNTPELITVNNLPINATYTYNIQVCNYVTNCTQAASNQTFAIDTYGPTIAKLNFPANNYNSSSQTVAFNVTLTDAVQGGLANVSLYTNVTGVWKLNATNSSIGALNNSQITITVSSLPQYNASVWNVQACSYSGNCTFAASNQSFIVDLTNPGVAIVNATATSQTTIFVNASVIDFNPLSTVILEMAFTGGNSNFSGIALYPSNANNNSGYYNFTVTNLGYDTYTFRVYANDSAGNVNLSASSSVTITSSSGSSSSGSGGGSSGGGGSIFTPITTTPVPTTTPAATTTPGTQPSATPGTPTEVPSTTPAASSTPAPTASPSGGSSSQASNDISQAQQQYQQAQSGGQDTSQAKHYLDLAQQAQAAGNYAEADYYAKQAQALLSGTAAASSTPSAPSKGLPGYAPIAAVVIIVALAGAYFLTRSKQ